MAVSNRWMTLRIELLHGGGRDFAPPPGRDLVLPPGTTFDDLANAINHSFARWDLGHLHSFTLDDGTLVANEGFIEDLITSPMSESILRGAPLSTPVKRLVSKGAEFLFVFDFGDEWTHRCTVTGIADPYQLLGGFPGTPVAYWGWGDLPDQYGRRWADDDGESDPPAEPLQLERPTRGRSTATAVDLGAVRAAAAGNDSRALVEAITGHRITDVLQQVGTAVHKVWLEGSRVHRTRLAPYVVALANRLSMRNATGDRILADQLLASAQGRDLEPAPTPVDLDLLITLVADGPGEMPIRVNTETGEIAVGDEDEFGGTGVEDLDDPRWLEMPVLDLVTWQDLADFTADVADAELRAKLETAIQGKGAFSRFRSIVFEHEVGHQWRDRSADLSLGRVREALFALGVRCR